MRVGPREGDVERVISGFGTHPRVQILTIQELLAGMKPDLPPLGRSEGFRRAPRERGRRPEQGGLDI